MTEETDDDTGDQAKSSSRELVFDRLQPFTSQQRPSVFNKIGIYKASKLSAFQRMKRDSQRKSSAFNKIARGKKPLGSLLV